MSIRVKGKSPREIHYTDGNWSVRTYWHNGVTQVCHKHTDGTTYIVPFGYTKANNGECSECYGVAPYGVMVVWTFFNWDKAKWV